MSRSRSRSARIVANSAVAFVAAMVVVGLATPVASAAPSPNGSTAGPAISAPSPAATRAALDPSLVAGRGADLGFTEQEAENAATNGTVIGPSRAAYTLPAEASGRSAVSSHRASTSSSRCPTAANAITVRYSIPGRADRRRHHRAAGRHGQRRPTQTMTLTSQYAWLYNLYPFSNDPTPTLARTRTGGSPSARCVPGDHAGAGSRRRSARTTSTTSSGCCSARPTRPATRSG